jgi:hypothetical protein
MNIRIFTLALFLFLFKDSFSQELEKGYRSFVSSFIACIKTDNKDKLAKMVIYPLEREYSIPSVKNKQEFMQRYNDIFDDELKQMIINSNPATDWSVMGWRGIMLIDGEVWLDFNGNLTGVNYLSKSEAKLILTLIENEKKNTYSSLSHYQKPVCILETSTNRIRIDDMGNRNYRYACWKINKSQKVKPDLILYGGIQNIEGSAGNSVFKFQNGEYVYECFIEALGDEPPAELTVYIGGRQILSQSARLIKK